jgi:predicted nucleotidyltransferase
MIMLPEKVRARLLAVLSKEPRVDKAILFGSRARGDARDCSDIDLALVGAQIPLSLNTKLREAAGLYPLDIVRIENLENNSLLVSIERDGVVIYSAEEAVAFYT